MKTGTTAAQFIEMVKSEEGGARIGQGRKYAPTFACPICGSHYPTIGEMIGCLNSPIEKGSIRVGDIVMLGGKWLGEAHAIPRDDIWIACIIPKVPGHHDHFRHIDQFYSWYVVTGLWNKNHTEACSCVSLMGQGSEGWNPTVDDTHCAIMKAGEEIVHPFWKKTLAGIEIRQPSEALKAEAALLAAAGIFTPGLV